MKARARSSHDIAFQAGRFFEHAEQYRLDEQREAII